jgi:heme-binding NEAT domain protein
MVSINMNPLSSKAAIADGTHNLPYQVNKPDSTSASIANDYFLKPAKLIVSNGSMKVQLTIKNSSWVTEFNPPGGAAIISSNAAADQRVVQFNVSNLNALKVAMKIDIDDIDYHHAYTVDFVFNGDGLPEKQTVTEQKPSTTPSQSGGKGNASSGSTTTSGQTSTNQATSQKPSTNQNSSNNQSTNQTIKDEEKEEEQEETETSSTPSEQEVTEEASPEEVIENPETSDAFPLYTIGLLIASVCILIVSKRKITI